MDHEPMLRYGWGENLRIIQVQVIQKNIYDSDMLVLGIDVDSPGEDENK